ncbi:MAG: energy transducer TonB [Acetobacteraceae bacterium]
MNAETRARIARRRGGAELRARRLTGRVAGRRDGRLSRSALISILVHVVVLAALVIFVQRREPAEFVPPAPIAMVFEHGGSTRATAPPAAEQGPTERAALPSRPEQKLPGPPPPAPPVPPRATPRATPRAAPQPAPQPASPGVAVHLPSQSQMQAFLEPPRPRAAPLPVTPPAPARRQAPTPRRAPLPPHTMFAPSLSFGTGRGAAPQVPSRGLNLALSQSELQRAFAPDFAVEGKIGPDWLAELTRWVNQRKYYPDSAVEMDQQGTVELSLVIERNGHVAGARIVQSSGSPFLDQAWLGMFHAATVPAFPAGTKADRIIIRASMHYILID